MMALSWMIGAITGTAVLAMLSPLIILSFCLCGILPTHRTHRIQRTQGMDGMCPMNPMNPMKRT